MTTIDLRRWRNHRASRQPPRARAAQPAASPPRRRLVTFEHHENGRWLALEVRLRGRGAGPPFALRDEHVELCLTIGQLEHLVLDAGPTALRRYHQQEAALLAGGLDDEPGARRRHDDADPNALTRPALAPACRPPCLAEPERATA